MRYLGGKGVIGKRISNAILDLVYDKDTIYIEPFCGALGVLRHLSPHFKECYANDISTDLIMLLEQVKDGTFENPKITREKWLGYKYSKESSAERAFAGYGCSFGGSWFNGYVDDNDSQYSSLLKIADKLQTTTFSNQNYVDFLKNFEFDPDEKYLIYLDPPYKGRCYKPWPEFDSNQFWRIVKELGSKDNVKVVVSELTAPPDVNCIFSMDRRNGFHNKPTEKLILTEKLYTTYEDKLLSKKDKLLSKKDKLFIKKDK